MPQKCAQGDKKWSHLGILAEKKKISVENKHVEARITKGPPMLYVGYESHIS